MIYPSHIFRSMAAQPRLKELWAAVPEVLDCPDWPDCAFWQKTLDAGKNFRQLPRTLRLLPEIKIGQRRKRKLARENREAGQPTLRRYETSILEFGEIPMRERNCHDYFNALIWKRFSRAKYALHERAYLSYLEFGRAVTGNLRNDLTDALTRFDEGGLIYFADGDAEAARELFRTLDHEAKAAFVQGKTERFEIFGHGLLEVWSQGGRNLTACVLVVDEEPGVEHESLLVQALRDMKEPAGRFGTLCLDLILDSTPDPGE